MIAKGILFAVKDLNIAIPVGARIQGTNGKLGMEMVLSTSNLINKACELWTQKRPS
jgi:succinyl-CoA synthetase beta subunit